jgi:DNA-binding transcriptional ArsR family regulator
MVHGGSDTRYQIFRTLVSSKKMLTLSEIAKRMKTDQQKISYHLPRLVASGLVIKDGYNYFTQPIFIDDAIHTLCAEKLSEIIEGFSNADQSIIVGEGQNKADVVIECLYALIKLVMPDQM